MFNREKTENYEGAEKVSEKTLKNLGNASIDLYRLEDEKNERSESERASKEIANTNEKIEALKAEMEELQKQEAELSREKLHHDAEIARINTARREKQKAMNRGVIGMTGWYNQHPEELDEIVRPEMEHDADYYREEHEKTGKSFYDVVRESYRIGSLANMKDEIEGYMDREADIDKIIAQTQGIVDKADGVSSENRGTVKVLGMSEAELAEARAENARAHEQKFLIEEYRHYFGNRAAEAGADETANVMNAADAAEAAKNAAVENSLNKDINSEVDEMLAESENNMADTVNKMMNEEVEVFNNGNFKVFVPELNNMAETEFNGKIAKFVKLVDVKVDENLESEDASGSANTEGEAKAEKAKSAEKKSAVKRIFSKLKEKFGWGKEADQDEKKPHGAQDYYGPRKANFKKHLAVSAAMITLVISSLASLDLKMDNDVHAAETEQTIEEAPDIDANMKEAMKNDVVNFYTVDENGNRNDYSQNFSEEKRNKIGIASDPFDAEVTAKGEAPSADKKNSIGSFGPATCSAELTGDINELEKAFPEALMNNASESPIVLATIGSALGAYGDDVSLNNVNKIIAKIKSQNNFENQEDVNRTVEAIKNFYEGHESKATTIKAGTEYMTMQAGKDDNGNTTVSITRCTRAKDIEGAMTAVDADGNNLLANDDIALRIYKEFNLVDAGATVNSDSFKAVKSEGYKLYIKNDCGAQLMLVKEGVRMQRAVDTEVVIETPTIDSSTPEGETPTPETPTPETPTPDNPTPEPGPGPKPGPEPTPGLAGKTGNTHAGHEIPIEYTPQPEDGRDVVRDEDNGFAEISRRSVEEVSGADATAVAGLNASRIAQDQARSAEANTRSTYSESTAGQQTGGVNAVTGETNSSISYEQPDQTNPGSINNGTGTNYSQEEPANIYKNIISQR